MLGCVARSTVFFPDGKLELDHRIVLIGLGTLQEDLRSLLHDVPLLLCASLHLPSPASSLGTPSRDTCLHTFRSRHDALTITSNISVISSTLALAACVVEQCGDHHQLDHREGGHAKGGQEPGNPQ